MPEQSPTPLPALFAMGDTIHIDGRGLEQIQTFAKVPARRGVTVAERTEIAAELVRRSNGYAALQERLEAAEHGLRAIAAFNTFDRRITVLDAVNAAQYWLDRMGGTE